jgi:hypothetical protein
MPARERADLFAETAERKALPEAIIEKDFWVCWVRALGKVLFEQGATGGDNASGILPDYDARPDGSSVSTAKD